MTMPKSNKELHASLLDLTLTSGLRPMTKEETTAFVRVNFMPSELVTPKNFDSVPWSQEPIIRVIMGRLENSCVADTVVDSRLPLWLAFLSSGVPGNAVTWAYDLRLSMEDSPVPFSLNLWAHRYATGVPSEETLSAFWASQKTRLAGLNWLDQTASWA